MVALAEMLKLLIQSTLKRANGQGVFRVSSESILRL